MVIKKIEISEGYERYRSECIINTTHKPKPLISKITQTYNLVSKSSQTNLKSNSNLQS
jgi:hypothetical protein